VPPFGAPRRLFECAARTGGMDETDILGLVLGGVALLMFATGLILVFQ
jgi:hypothetical protein